MIVQEKPSPKGGMVRKFLYLVVLSVVATLAFASVAQAQSTYSTSASTSNCSGAVEAVTDGEYFPEGRVSFFPDAGACTLIGASPINAPVLYLNATAYDPDTGEDLGLVKDLDPDLTSGVNSTNHQELCGAFPTLDGTPGGMTAQQYFDGAVEFYSQGANAQERELLDPDGDGQACTSEDEAFLAGNTGGETGDGSQEQYENNTGGASGEDGQQGGEISELPDTGGPSLLLAVAGLLVGFGLLGLFVAIRRLA